VLGGLGRIGRIGRTLGGAAVVVLSTPILDLQAASDTGTFDDDDITADTTPDFDVTFSLGMEVGDILRVRNGETELTTHEVTSGDVSAGVIVLGLSALAEGEHVISARLERFVNGRWYYGEYGDITITITATPP
jgi:hypothetical protein